MYFRKFPDIYYQYDINGKPTLKIVSDITTNVRFRKEILDNVTLYDSYDVQDGETPEIVAAKLYGSTEYHWVVMLANDVHDHLEDWPLDSRTLDLMIQDKYNKFEVTSWEYTGRVITATIPNHPIILSDNSRVIGENIRVLITNNTTGVSRIEYANPFNLSSPITHVTSNTITFTIPDSVYPNPPANSTITPYGGFTLYTDNRHYLTHHWVNKETGIIVDPQFFTFEEVSAVTNYEHEVIVNDSKRRIKLISPDLLANILTQFKAIV